MQQLQPNTVLQGGKYRIEEKIGQGGFGITYRACQPLMLGRKVCIKEFCLKQHFSRESTSSVITYPNETVRRDAEIFQQKFIKEAQTLYSMHHPNIMEIYDIFEENNTAYYVMEYIEGESLKGMLDRRGCIPEAEAMGYIRNVAEALKYVHSRNINHFDIKPANILVRSSDKEVILIDFGTAKHYDNKTGNATTMSAGLLSPGYAPIEQYQQGGVSIFTPETDIYALGATLYKLLTGVTPPEPTEIISNGIPELPSHISQTTKDLIRWSMQLRKEERPHSCDEFLNALPTNVDCVFNSRITEKNDEVDDVTISINAEETTIIQQKEKGEKNIPQLNIRAILEPKPSIKTSTSEIIDLYEQGKSFSARKIIVDSLGCTYDEAQVIIESFIDGKTYAAAQYFRDAYNCSWDEAKRRLNLLMGVRSHTQRTAIKDRFKYSTNTYINNNYETIKELYMGGKTFAAAQYFRDAYNCSWEEAKRKLDRFFD